MTIAAQERTCVLPGSAALPASDEPCVLAVRQLLDRVGDKWSLYVIVTLRDKPLRFNEIQRNIEGISHRMLALTLRGLERDGLVTRTVFATVPPAVSYGLTDLGGTLLGPVMGLVEWVNANRALVAQAREAFDRKREPAEAPQGVRRITSWARREQAV